MHYFPMGREQHDQLPSEKSNPRPLGISGRIKIKTPVVVTQALTTMSTNRLLAGPRKSRYIFKEARNTETSEHREIARRLTQGQTSWTKRSGAPCSSPDEVATQQTFSILMPIMKGPPWGPRMSL